MDNEQLKEIKEMFMQLEQMFSRASSAEELVKDTPEYLRLFARVEELMTDIEWMPIGERCGENSIRDAMRECVEAVAFLRNAVTTNIKLNKGDSLQARLDVVRTKIVAVSNQLNSGGTMK